VDEEDLTALQEELAAAQAELEQLQVAAADSEARAEHLESQVSELRDELARAQGEALEREEELGTQNEALGGQLRSAAERYRALVLESSPELPAELVAGETVEEIEASLERAHETVSKVRGHLESQAQAGRVPVGAPARSAPDLSGLSAHEKIRYGLERRARS